MSGKKEGDKAGAALCDVTHRSLCHQSSGALKIALRHTSIPKLFFLASDLSPSFAQQSFHLRVSCRVRIRFDLS